MTIEKKRDELNFQQRKFVNLYLSGESAKNAAIKAGYSEKSAESMGSQLIKKDKIKKEIDRKEKEFEMAALITKESVLSGILNVANDQEASNTEKLNAYKLLGQYLALFTDKQIIQSTNTNPFEQLSDDEIMKMYEQQKLFKKQA